MNLSIICEFNPFHKGHKVAIDNCVSNADGGIVVALMSGNFVQRGELAVTDKYTRAKWAIEMGADVVLELPPYFAITNAERFARGGVSLLSKLGFVDGIVFGSECGDVSMLENYLNVDDVQMLAIDKRIKDYLAEGQSYVKSSYMAYQEVVGGDVMRTPNNVLGIEYIKSIKKLNSNITPITYKREIDASATAVRNELSKGNVKCDMVEKQVEKYLRSITKDNLDYINDVLLTSIKIKLLQESKENLRGYSDIIEGLENNFKNAITQNTLQEFYEAIKSKRHTMAKIKRASINILLGINEQITVNALQNCNYAVMLACNERGKKVLSMVDDNFTIVTKYKDTDKLNETDKALYDLTVRCDAIYDIITKRQSSGRNTLFV